MRRRILLAFSLLASYPAVAGHKKEPPPTYDYQGDIRWVIIHHDTVSSMTFSDGSTTTVHCDFDGANSDCGVGSGANYFVRFDEKDKDASGHTFHEIACCVKADTPQPKECSDFAIHGFYDCNPLQKLGNKLPLGDAKSSLTFRYRPVVVRLFSGDKHPGKGFCVPYEISDRKGRVKSAEACYLR